MAGGVSVIAQPMAEEKLLKKVLKMVKAGENMPAACSMLLCERISEEWGK